VEGGLKRPTHTSTNLQKEDRVTDRKRNNRSGQTQTLLVYMRMKKQKEREDGTKKTDAQTDTGGGAGGKERGTWGNEKMKFARSKSSHGATKNEKNWISF